jgi:hypothetical protein
MSSLKSYNLLLAFCILLSFHLLVSGCMRAKPYVNSYTIPADCMKVTIKDFTKACQPLKNGDLTCDGVHVRVNCRGIK